MATRACGSAVRVARASSRRRERSVRGPSARRYTIAPRGRADPASDGAAPHRARCRLSAGAARASSGRRRSPRSPQAVGVGADGERVVLLVARAHLVERHAGQEVGVAPEEQSARLSLHRSELEERPRRLGRNAARRSPHAADARVGGADRPLVVGLGRMDRHRAAGPVGREAAGLDRGDLNAERRDLVRHHLAEAGDRELRRLVRAQPRRAAPPPADRAHLQDAAAALLAHDRQHRAGDVDDAIEIRVDLRAEVVERDVLGRVGVGVAGVVDEHVDAAERVDCLGDCARGLFRLRHVERHRADAIAVRVDQRAEIAGLAGRRDDAVPRGERGLDERTAETARAAGDEPDLGNGLGCVHALECRAPRAPGQIGSRPTSSSNRANVSASSPPIHETLAQRSSAPRTRGERRSR